MILGRAFWSLGAAVGAYAFAAPAQAPEPLAPAPPLEQSMQALLETLRERGQLPALALDQRERVLAGVLEHLGMGTETDDPNKPAVLSGPITLKGLYAYLRIVQVGPGLAEACEAALGDVANGHYEAVILDLRGTTGTILPNLDGAFVPLREAAVPVACLIDGRTAHAAAELGALLRQRDHAVLIGQPTAPPQPATEPITLRTGERVWLPVRTPAALPPPAPVQPDVLVRDARASLVTLDTADPANWSQLAAADEALRRAVDLLTATRILRQR